MERNGEKGRQGEGGKEGGREESASAKNCQNTGGSKV